MESNDATKVVAESHLRSCLQFVSSYHSQLSSMESVLGCHPNKTKDKALNPVSIEVKMEEKLSLVDIITTDNKILNKVLIVFSALCNETRLLEEEAKLKFYNQLLFYGESGEFDQENHESIEDGELYLQISRLFPLFQQILCFVRRCREVLKNTIQQLAALYNKSFPQVIDVDQVHLSAVFEHMAVLLRTLLTIDEIVANNSVLQNHWKKYKGIMKSLRLNPSSFDVKENQITPLEKLVRKIDSLVMSHKLTEHCMEQDFDDSGIPVVKNSFFLTEFSINLRYMFSTMEPKLGDNTAECHHTLQYVGLCCLFVFKCRLFHEINRKLFRQIWDINKKLPCVVLIGPVTWFPDHFFASFLPGEFQVVESKLLDQCKQIRRSWLSSKIDGLPREFQNDFLTLNNWLVKMNSLSDCNKSLNDLTEKCKLYFEGLSLAGKMKKSVETLLNLHVSLEKPMSVNVVLLLCRLISMLKSINDTFYKYSKQIAETTLNIIQHIQYQILISVESVKRKLISDKRYSNRRLDMLSALVLFCNCIDSLPSPQRIIVTKLSLALSVQPRLLRDEDLISLLAQISHLERLGSRGLLRLSYEATDLSGFYWHRMLLDTYLNNLHVDTYDVTDLHFMMSALEDCVPCLRSVLHLESSKVLVDNYRSSIIETFREEFLNKFYKNVENDLRLSVHTHLKIDDRNPFRVGIKSLRQGLALSPINFMGEFIDIKAKTTHYLDQTFYNLTTVALHDWKTYGEMRKIASDKYQLEMQEVHLPNQQLEQGLDVLEIMRNIHVFVPKYLYNLSNQIFVERWSNNKHLNTINIQHIANSIRTHGTGIINTTVNFTFQFLKKKFFIFSQFLFDEHIKSRLVKDIREFRTNCESLHHQYPFESAERFNRGIRKLGLAQDGSTFLDQFRLLISHIGNAMGYIRMVRTGGLHFCSDGISFVPDLEEIVNFEELAKADLISDEVTESFTQFDSCVGTLAKNAAEGSDYFRLLVDVFAPEFRDKKNMHLLNFYAIIPPLTINFVEHVIISKEKMNKKNKTGAAFTDDGFAMGLAYILKLLNQNSQFDALHWFSSVRKKYTNDSQQQQQGNKRGGFDESENLQQTRTLALKRIGIYQREFDLLNYSLSSARIFFRAGSQEKTENEKTTKNEENKEDEKEVQSTTEN